MINKDKLIEVFNKSDLEWVIKFNKDQIENFTNKINQEIVDLEKVINDLISEKSLGNPIDLKSELVSNTSELKAFIQAFASPMTINVKAMIYFLTKDIAEIKSIKLNYTLKNFFEMEIHYFIENEGINEDIKVVSSDLWDMEILRHFAYMKMDEKPIISGYFPIDNNDKFK